MNVRPPQDEDGGTKDHTAGWHQRASVPTACSGHHTKVDLCSLTHGEVFLFVFHLFSLLTESTENININRQKEIPSSSPHPLRKHRSNKIEHVCQKKAVSDLSWSCSIFWNSKRWTARRRRRFYNLLDHGTCVSPWESMWKSKVPCQIPWETMTGHRG